MKYHKVDLKSKNKNILIDEDLLVNSESIEEIKKNMNSRVGGKFKGKSFRLDEDYDYVIGADNLGFLILIPLKKNNIKESSDIKKSFISFGENNVTY